MRIGVQVFFSIQHQIVYYGHSNERKAEKLLVQNVVTTAQLKKFTLVGEFHVRNAGVVRIGERRSYDLPSKS